MNSFKSSVGGQYSSNDDENKGNCGRLLLGLAARGNAIITELNRLIELVPAPFARRPDGDRLYYLDKARKYTLDHIVCDFSYFKGTELFENKIEADKILKRADEDFCDNYLDILTRFYLTFESIQRYASELNRFIVDFEADYFVGLTLEIFLESRENRQLLCEVYYLLGCMLLTVDEYFEGGLRERLIVAYYRYSSYKSSPDSCLDDTCNLLRSTSYKGQNQELYRGDKTSTNHRPEDYPESFFSRTNVDQIVLNHLIAGLQSSDLYNHTTLAFPNPEHRSSALSKQASMLYVLLYFCPNILKTQRSRMREISDKFFFDNWVISIYMGQSINLIEAWSPYKAARESLYQLFDIDSIDVLINQYNVRFSRNSKHLQDYLKGGCSNEAFVLDNCTKMLNQIREANITLKWMLLHSIMMPSWQLKLTKAIHAKLSENQPKHDRLCEFLQHLCLVEANFTSTYVKLINHSEVRCHEHKLRALETMNELLIIFSDTRPNRWVKVGANSSLTNVLASSIHSLETTDFSQPSSLGALTRLINVIETARDTYSDGKSLQVVQLFGETKENLFKIMRYISLPEGMLVALKVISDFSYAWSLTDKYFTPHLQQIIKDNPTKIPSIEAVFLKIALSYNSCLNRIQQANLKADLNSVSHYYSTRLVTYVRNVLHILPATIMELVSSLVALQTDDVFVDMPSKLSLDSLRDYALPEKRFRKIKLTYKISQYAEGMIKLQNSCVGQIKIDSKMMLESGIRRELIKKISDSIETVLQFPNPQNSSTNGYNELQQTAQNLLGRLIRLASIMDGYKRSLEYVQDYLFIHGLRMLQEESNRIVKSSINSAKIALIDDMANFQKDSTSNEQKSTYHSSEVSISVHSDSALQSNFIVKILGEILKLTNPRETIYDEQVNAWFDQKVHQHEQLADVKIFELIHQALGAAGLNGLDQICCTLLMLELKELNCYIDKSTSCKSNPAEVLVGALRSIETLSQNHLNEVQKKTYNKQADTRTFASALGKLAPYSERIINHLLRIGQLQAIRMNVGCVLSSKCRCDARILFACLEALDTSLLSLLKSEKKASQQMPTGGVISSHRTNENHFNSNTSIDQSLVDDEHEFGGDLCGSLKDDLCYDEDLAYSQLADHLERVGLSDPLSKIYTLTLSEPQPSAHSSATFKQTGNRHMAIELIFLVLLDQCSKFHFSESISGFAPKQSRGFMGTSSNVDGQPLFYGIMTVLNHYQPFVEAHQQTTPTTMEAAREPLVRLLRILSLYVKCSLDTTSAGASNCEPSTMSSVKPQDLTLEVANVVLSMIELLRLARQPSDELIAETFLPNYIADTFQFTLCHLGN